MTRTYNRFGVPLPASPYRTCEREREREPLYTTVQWRIDEGDAPAGNWGYGGNICMCGLSGYITMALGSVDCACVCAWIGVATADLDS